MSVAPVEVELVGTVQEPEEADKVVSELVYSVAAASREYLWTLQAHWQMAPSESVVVHEDSQSCLRGFEGNEGLREGISFHPLERTAQDRHQ